MTLNHLAYIKLDVNFIYCNIHLFIVIIGLVPGSSSGGSRVIRRGDGVGVLGKNLFNYGYIERLEMDSVVGNISGEKEAE